MSKTKNTLRLGAARFIGVAVQFISVPIVWDVLGGDLLGACYFLIAISRWVSLIDIGYDIGIQRLMTRAFDSDDRERGFTLYRMHVLILLSHAAVGFGVFAALGQFVVVPNLPGDTAYGSLFLAGAVVFSSQYLYMSSMVYFQATRQFKYVAMANGSQFLISGLTGLGLTLWLRRPEAYLAGYSAGYGVVYLFNLYRGLGQARRAEGRQWFDKEAFKYCFGFGARLYPAKLCSVSMGTFDRILITSILGPAKLTGYTNAARYSEVASEALPLHQTLLPDLTKAHMEGKRNFAELVDRGSRITLMVGCGILFIPCAFGGPLLQIWLQDKYVPEMAIVMLVLGMFRAFESYSASLVMTMLASGAPKKITLVTLVTAALVLALTYPAIITYGVIGAASIRLLIALVLFVPVTWYIWRFVVPDISFWPWISKLAGTMGIAVVFSALGYWFCQTDRIVSTPWLALIVLPFFMVAFFYVVDLLQLASIPESIKARIRNFVPRGGGKAGA
ncbi:MAG: polysaccharide biosynthesis protein [Armatimonadetes bacterium]|nr:polysaccharide biosynthesis protein [Armatimonadota bacterium]